MARVVNVNRIEMMTMTTSSSSRLNPLSRFLFMDVRPVEMAELDLVRISHQYFGFRCICSVSECASGLKSVAIAMV